MRAGVFDRGWVVAQLDIEIAQDALAATGALIIPSFAAPGPPGVNVERIYRSRVRFLIASYPWSFAQKQAELSRKGDGDGWTSRFAMPVDLMGMPDGYYSDQDCRRSIARFELDDGDVQADADRLWCDYKRLPPVTIWPDYFVELVLQACKVEFALAIREDRPLHDKLHREVYGSEQYMGQGGLWSLTTAIDARSTPTKSASMTGDPIRRVRQSGVGFFYNDDDWPDA